MKTLLIIAALASILAGCADYGRTSSGSDRGGYMQRSGGNGGGGY